MATLDKNNLNQKSNDERINFRLKADDKRIIYEASKLNGYSSVTEYIKRVLIRDSQKIIEREQKLFQSKKDKEIFFNELNNPSEPNQALKKAFKAYKEKYSK